MELVGFLIHSQLAGLIDLDLLDDFLHLINSGSLCQLLGGFLCLCTSGIVFFFSVNGSAVFLLGATLQEILIAQVGVSVGVSVVVHFFALFMLAQSSLFKGQGVVLFVVVSLCQQTALAVLLIALHIGTLAVNIAQRQLCTAGSFQLGDLSVQSSLLCSRQSEAFADSQIVQCVIALCVLHCIIQESVSPGLAGLGIVLGS